jgi:hypothetical protein
LTNCLHQHVIFCPIFLNMSFSKFLTDWRNSLLHSTKVWCFVYNHSIDCHSRNHICLSVSIGMPMK